MSDRTPSEPLDQPVPPRTQADYLRGRIATLRAALELLWTQVEQDQGEPYHTIGWAKVELVTLEEALRVLDRHAPSRATTQPEGR
jgi:hypothetical protein